ncbi:hypothetical protein P9302_01710 [Brevibacillus agri]|uniref:hypothetical protein n=1 Tax=Brevibacillus agri TaxID=51101 RepID=UPI002E209EB0|nr:hypothetical protein [Brevibacillus agri]
MFDFNSLQSSVAQLLDELPPFEKIKAITFTGCIDEMALYSDSNRKLKELESSIVINYSMLESIVKLSEQMQVASFEKEEVLKRIDWLQRLYKAKSELSLLDSKEKIKQLRFLIAPVQTCPLKDQLVAELDFFEVSLPFESTTSVEPTAFELLMENAIHEASDDFINLGKSGRDYVIAEVLKQEGDQATTAHVQALADQLEQRVIYLSEVLDRAELIAELDQLPLSVFSSLQEVKKERVADTLIQEKGWTGLFSLERRITQISKAIDREERENYEKENVIDLPDGKAAATIDLRYNPID